MKRSNLVLRSVARWLVLGFMVSALSGCGDPAVTSIPQSELQKPEVQQQVAQAARVPIEVVQEAVALQIAYEQAVAEQANPTPKTVSASVVRYLTPKMAFAKDDDDRTNKSAQVKEVDKDEKENHGKNDCNKNKNEGNNGNNNSNGNNHDACSDDDTTKVVNPPVVTPPVVVNPPVVTPPVVVATKVYSLASTVPFVKGVETNIQLTSNVGTAPYVFSATNLPRGLVLSSTGIITGKPAVSGVSAANISMVDAKGIVYKKAMVSITAIHQPLANVVLPPFKRGTVSSLQLVPDSATGPYTFLGITPNGTRVTATGMIYGNPVSVGTSSAILITKNSYNDIAIKIAPATVQ